MPAAARPAGGRGWSRVRPASPTRRSGRCFSAARALAAAATAIREPANRYEWPCPGDLLHMDTSRYARFLRPGHRVTGDRSQRSRNWMRPETRVGYDYAHAIVDDHSRLAYVELHDDETAATVTGFVERALAFFARHGIDAQAADDRQRLQLRQEPLTPRAARRPRDPTPDDRALPATHQRQGRTLPPDDGPRMGLRRSPTAHIDTAPKHCHTGSTTTTTSRPHSSIGDRPPISRVHNVCG